MNADYLASNDRPATTPWTAEKNARFAKGRAAHVAAANSRRAARKPSVWGAPFDAPDAGQSSYTKAQAILDAAVVAAVKTPLQIILASGTASVTFKPNGDKVTVVSRGVENWGTRILSVAEARLHYRKLVKAGFLVW
jgi:hypothetical protein